MLLYCPMGPIAEIIGSKPRKLRGNLEVAYGEEKIFLIPATTLSAEALKTIITEHPKTQLTLETVEGDEKYKLSVEGVKVTKFVVGTERLRVLDPVAE